MHIDGDHDYVAVKKDIDKYSKFLTQGGLMILDDYDKTHQGVRKAVHEFLINNSDFEIVAINFQGDAYGSICLKRTSSNP